MLSFGLCRYFMKVKYMQAKYQCIQNNKIFFKLKLNERGVIKIPTLTCDPHLRMHTARTPARTPAHIGVLFCIYCTYSEMQ